MTAALFAALLPQIASAAVTLLVPLIVALIVKQFQKLGIDIEAKNREALQSALHNAAITAVSRAGIDKNGVSATAVDYVKSSVPDAIKKFGLDRDKIKKLLEPHLAKAVNTVEK